MRLPSAPLLLAALLCSVTPALFALTVREDSTLGTISVLRDGSTEPLIVQNANPGFRPYLHPLAAPDGGGVLTEFSPGHHRHQTGIYWGITRLNGRDYFHNPGPDHWRRVSITVETASGPTVVWKTVYDLLGAEGSPVLRETQRWTARDEGAQYFLDVEWSGEALADVVIEEFAYGGLFIRMPWKAGMEGTVVNSNRQTNERANGQRALWVDVGLKIEGRDDLAHLAIFDHPSNRGHPLPWRVDGQFGVGPSPATLGTRSLARGASESFRHQIMAYTGPLSEAKVDSAWRAYTGVRYDNVMWRRAPEESRRAVRTIAPDSGEAGSTSDAVRPAT